MLNEAGENVLDEGQPTSLKKAVSRRRLVEVKSNLDRKSFPNLRYHVVRGTLRTVKKTGTSVTLNCLTKSGVPRAGLTNLKRRQPAKRRDSERARLLVKQT